MALDLFTLEFSAEFDGLWPLPTTGARPHFAYPFWLGAENPILSVITVPPRWVTLTPNTERWVALGSNRHRFERIYARPTSTFGQSVNFNYEIRSQFPLILSSDQQAVITSSITNP